MTDVAPLLLTYKYRLGPEKRHHRALERFMEQQRQLFIAGLDERIQAWQKSAGIAVAHIRRERAAGIVTFVEVMQERYVTQRRDELEPDLRAAIERYEDLVLAKAGRKAIADARKLLPIRTKKRATIEAERAAGAVTLRLRMRGPKPTLGQPQVGNEAKETLQVRRREHLPADKLKALETYETEVLSGIRRANWGLNELHQSQSLTEIRAADPEFARIPRRIQRMTLKRLERAYKSFFAGGGFPRFPGYHHWDSFGFDAYERGSIDGVNVRFKGLPGALRIKMDRPLPEFTDPETGEVARDIRNIHFKADGLHFKRGRRRWFICVQTAVPVRENRQGLGRHPIGVDWGTSVLAALSTGEEITNPRPGEALARELHRAERTLSRRKKGSRRRLKARIQLKAVQRKIANRRRNHLDKVSSRLPKHFDLVAAEQIEVKSLMDAERPGEDIPEFIKRRRNREVLDTAPYMLRQMLAYKAQREGAKLILVDPKLTTQECSMCGKLHFKELNEPIHVCRSPGIFFGMQLPRKVNAARVILKRALEQNSAPAADDRGGTVPEGAEQSANGGTGRRRPGNTEGGQLPPARRPHVGLPYTHDHGQPPKPPPGRLRTEPS